MTRKSKFGIIIMTIIVLAIGLSLWATAPADYGHKYDSIKSNSALDMDYNIMFLGESAYTLDNSYICGTHSYKVVTKDIGGVLYNEYEITFLPAFWVEIKISDNSNPIKVYVKGVQMSDLDVAYYPSTKKAVFRVQKSLNIADSDIRAVAHFHELEQEFFVDKSDALGYVYVEGDMSTDVNLGRVSYKRPLTLRAVADWSSVFAYWELEGAYYSSDEVITVRNTDKTILNSHLTAVFYGKDTPRATKNILVKNYQYVYDGQNYVKSPLVGVNNVKGWYAEGDRITANITSASPAYVLNKVTITGKIGDTTIYSAFNYSNSFDLTVPEGLPNNVYFEINSYFCTPAERTEVSRVTVEQNYQAGGRSQLTYGGMSGSEFWVKNGDSVTVDSVYSVGFGFNGYSTSYSTTPDDDKRSKTLTLSNINADVSLYAIFSFGKNYKEDFESATDGNLVSNMTYGKWVGSTVYDTNWQLREMIKDGIVNKSVYFGLPTDADAMYSMEASLTSPRLDLMDNLAKYTFSFDWLSKSNDIPNVLTVMVSEDGINYRNLSSSTTNMEIKDIASGNFVTQTAEFSASIHYIRFVVKVYYDNNTDRGIYLDNIKVTSNDQVASVPQFTYTIGATDFRYNGEPQAPSVKVACANSDYEYRYVVLPTANGEEAIDAGDYTLSVIIYNAKNLIVDVKQVEFTIAKLDIVLGGLQDNVNYTSNDRYLIFQGLRVKDGNGDYINDYGDVSIELKETNAEGDNVIRTTLSSKIFAVKSSVDYSYQVKVTILPGRNYNGYESGYIDVFSKEPNTAGKEVVLYVEKSQSKTYNGQPQGIDYLASAQNVEDKVKIVYKQGQTIIDNPVNAGIYEAEITVGDYFYTSTLTILPKTISYANYVGMPLDKFYDGTNRLFYQYKLNPDDLEYVYSLSDTVMSHDLTLPQKLEGDDVVLVAKNAFYARDKGKTYLQLANISLKGEDIANYVLDKDFSCKDPSFECEIKTVALQLVSNIDELGRDIITFLEKTYNGGFEAIFNNEEIIAKYGAIKGAPLEFFGMVAGDKLTLDNIIGLFIDKYAGNNIEIELNINDKTLLDRYQSGIDLGALKSILKSNIVPKRIALETGAGTVITVSDKIYDKSDNADLTIEKYKFNSDVVKEDLAILTNEEVFLSYNSSKFRLPDVGKQSVAITGMTLNTYNAEFIKVINSYYLENYNENHDVGILSGTISPKTVELDKTDLNMKAGEAMPDIGISEKDLEVGYYAYASYDDATKDINRITLNLSLTGEFYLRVYIAGQSSGNYILAQNILTLNIIADMREQILKFLIGAGYEHTDADGVYYIIMSTGNLTINVASFDKATNEQTYLPVSLTLTQEQPHLVIVSQGKFLAQMPGWCVITANQKNDSLYNSAEPVSIRVLVTEETDIVADYRQDDTYYYGDILPDMTGTVDMASQQGVNGEFISDKETVSAGTANYKFTFRPTETLLGEYSGVEIKFVVEKLTLQLTFGDIVRGYFEQVDYLSKAKASLVRGQDYANAKRVALSDLINKGLELSVINVNILEWTEGTYRLFLGDEPMRASLVANGSPYKIEFVSTSADYLASVANSSTEGKIWITEEVVKNKLEVKLANFEKYYGQEIPDKEELTNYCTVKGRYNPADLEGILRSIEIFAQARKDSPLGEYLVVLMGDKAMFNTKYDISVVNGYMEITKSPLKILAQNVGHVYGESVNKLGYVLEGFYVVEDLELISQYIRLSTIVNSLTGVGTYDITVSFLGELQNYTVVGMEKGTYTVTPATLQGITYNNQKVLYNGGKHRLTITYDSALQPDLTVQYSINSIVEVGKYQIVATVSRPNYYSQDYTATLIIESPKLSSSSVNFIAEISLMQENMGFDPDTTLVMSPSNDNYFNSKVNEQLKKSTLIEESVWGVYNLKLYNNGEQIALNSAVLLRIKVSDVKDLSKLRVLQYKNEQFIEMTYKVNGAYLEFVTNDIATVIIFEEKNIFTRNTADLVTVILFAVVISVIVVVLIVRNTKKGVRQSRRSRNRHHKWL